MPATKRGVVYIAGPMTGLPDCNFEAFNTAAKEWEIRGWHVLNPATHLNGTMEGTYALYMRASIHDLLIADAIALLPGWEDSQGATLEATIADRLNLNFFEAETGRLIAPPESVRYRKSTAAAA